MSDHKYTPEGISKDEMSRRIHEQIQKNTRDTQFELNIENEDFRNIPDAPTRTARRTTAEIQPRNTTGQDFKRLGNAPPERTRRARNADTAKEVQRKKRRKSGRIFGSVIYVIGVISVSFVLAFFLLTSMSDFLGLYKPDNYIDVTIPEKADLKEISKILKSKGVINQSLSFQLFAKMSQKDESFQSGDFKLNSNRSYDEIFTALSRTEKTDAIIKISLPEGRTAREMGVILEEKGVCSLADFLEAVKTADARYDWQKEIVNVADPDRYLTYEGYLFPNTHDMWSGEKADSVVMQRYLNDFNNRWDPSWTEAAEKRGMTMDEVITLASIIEREGSGHTEELDKISAIFHNRLKKGSPLPLLQSDVTIDYVENDIKPNVPESDHERYANAYNTYKRKGLPAGPVCNPGAAAIEAALYPDNDYLNGGYYYFVTDAKDEFYYAKTLSEHNANVAKAKSVTDDEGKSKVGGTSTQEDE